MKLRLRLRMLQIVRVSDDLPDGFATLRVEAAAEGYRHMERLADDWASGAERFDKAGEALFAAYVEGELAGVGGVTREPSDPEGDVMRARRLYVLPRFRGTGAGRALVSAIVQQAFEEASRCTVNAGRDAPEFWDRMGFARVDAPALTHELRRNFD